VHEAIFGVYTSEVGLRWRLFVPRTTCGMVLEKEASHIVQSRRRFGLEVDKEVH